MNDESTIRCEIIAVGSELLTPHFLDTNSLFITEKLHDLGIETAFKTIVGDCSKDLQHCFETSFSRARLVVTIGGLGPTRDDLTRETLAETLHKKLIYHPDILDSIRTRFQRHGLKMSSSNKKQAYIPEGAEILDNPNGTAPGIYMEENGRIFVLLPGPPKELKPMFSGKVIPRLEKFRQGFSFRRVLRITGPGESAIETKISDLYPEDPQINVTMLASPGEIDIHLLAHSAKSSEAAKEKILALSQKIESRLGERIYSTDGKPLEEIIGDRLRQRGETLAVAESCTGGLLGHRITNVPGSSDYFLQGVQSYSNEAKQQRLGIPSDLINKHGAVSSQTAEAMAEGIRRSSGADYGLAITGIAGPGGGTTEKPVGLVYTALSWDNGVQVQKNIFFGDRETVKFRSSQKSLDMLRVHLIHRAKGD